jgi:CHASE1-domain containing sensor protein
MSPLPRLLAWPRQGAAVAVTLVLLLGSAFSGLAYRESQPERNRPDRNRVFPPGRHPPGPQSGGFLPISRGALFSLRSVFIGSAEVTRPGFERAAHEILARYPGIAALEWVARVPAADRDAVEQRAAQELARPFQFTELDVDGRLVRAGARAEYLPILYVTPLPGNERALGYDLAGGPTRETLVRARTARQMVATEPFRLVQIQRSQRKRHGLDLAALRFNSPAHGSMATCRWYFTCGR